MMAFQPPPVLVSCELNVTQHSGDASAVAPCSFTCLDESVCSSLCFNVRQSSRHKTCQEQHVYSVRGLFPGCLIQGTHAVYTHRWQCVFRYGLCDSVWCRQWRGGGVAGLTVAWAALSQDNLQPLHPGGMCLYPGVMEAIYSLCQHWVF